MLVKFFWVVSNLYSNHPLKTKSGSPSLNLIFSWAKCSLIEASLEKEKRERRDIFSIFVRLKIWWILPLKNSKFGGHCTEFVQKLHQIEKIHPLKTAGTSQFILANSHYTLNHCWTFLFIPSWAYRTSIRTIASSAMWRLLFSPLGTLCCVVELLSHL